MRHILFSCFTVCRFFVLFLCFICYHFVSSLFFSACCCISSPFIRFCFTPSLNRYAVLGCSVLFCPQRPLPPFTFLFYCFISLVDRTHCSVSLFSALCLSIRAALLSCNQPHNHKTHLSSGVVKWFRYDYHAGGCVYVCKMWEGAG